MARYDDEEKRPRRRLRVMHLTLSMLALLFVLKVSDVYFDTRALHDAISEARAEDTSNTASNTTASNTTADAAKPADGSTDKTADATKPADAVKPGDASADKKDDKAAADAKSDDKKSGDVKAKEEMTLGTGKTPISKIEELKAQENAAPYTQDEIDLLQNLTKRRQELDAREQDLDVKAKVLDATEKRIDDKVAAMKQLQGEMTKVVAEYNQQQDKEIGSLVKIYQNMKPSDAANVFNQLDMPILLKIIAEMSERKVAPILAGMDPKRAREVTEELAELRRKQEPTAATAANAAAPAAPGAPPPAAQP